MGNSLFVGSNSGSVLGEYNGSYWKNTIPGSSGRYKLRRGGDIFFVPRYIHIRDLDIRNFTAFVFLCSRKRGTGFYIAYFSNSGSWP